MYYDSWACVACINVTMQRHLLACWNTCIHRQRLLLPFLNCYSIISNLRKSKKQTTICFTGTGIVTQTTFSFCIGKF
ncbi:hypothetical protein VNO78_08595 [Psophocarpus tetragonolobus]|uniref:Uncharacterized protein n=1 Tax=Psophocarpus tetragonolobus TaxID=3891 RepID=A0AAN9XTJ4_PSOTE